MAWAKVTASSTKRGYGAQHRKLREALLPKAYGQPCARCGRPMLPGQALHLDHTDTRTGYLGFSHKHCNMVAAARNSTRKRLAKQNGITKVHRW